MRLVRGATTLITFLAEGLWNNGAQYGRGDGASNNYLDSPATTSATTYKVQFMNQNNTASVSVQNVSTTSVMILMEIGA